MKVTIEGIGTFSIPSKAATYFQEMAEERIAAIASLEAAEAGVQAIVERFASLENRMEKMEIEYGWRARAEAAETILLRLTPGGSEFAGDPARCERWVRDRLTGVIEQVQMRKAAEAEVARLRSEMSTLYRRVDLVNGETDEPVQFVGVYVTRWGERVPTVAFVQWTDNSGQDAAGRGQMPHLASTS